MKGSTLAKRRHSMGMTQPELAALLGITMRTLRRWEGADVLPKRVEHMVRWVVEKHKQPT